MQNIYSSTRCVQNLRMLCNLCSKSDLSEVYCFSKITLLWSEVKRSLNPQSTHGDFKLYTLKVCVSTYIEYTQHKYRICSAHTNQCIHSTYIFNVYIPHTYQHRGRIHLLDMWKVHTIKVISMVTEFSLMITFNYL